MASEEIKSNDSNPEIQTLAQSEGQDRNWRNIAEVRMFMYVVPVAIVLAIIAFIISKFSGG